MDSSLRDVLDRYGPTLAFIAAIVLLVVLLPSNTHGSSNVSSGGSNGGPAAGQAVATQGGTGSAQASTAAAATTGSASTGAGTTGAATGSSGAGLASAAGTASASGARPAPPGAGCRPDGRQAGIAPYMPPCQPLFTGDNGGATARGVTGTYIKVAYYIPQANAATQAALVAAGVSDQQADVDRIMDVLRHYFNTHYETWGREVRFTRVNASGANSDDVAGRADANAIADAGYFAAITAGGTSTDPVGFDETMAKRGVICVACTVSESNSFYSATKGLSWGALPTAREYYTSVADYWGKRMVGNDPATGKPRTAQYAGPPPGPGLPDYRTQPRKFAVIWLSSSMGTVDPGAQEERDNFVNNILPKYGIKLGDDAGYNYDITQGPTEAQTIIAKFHADNDTTVACFCDPLMPEFFTREATKEQYFPEWFETGTALTDTTFFGRIYDQQQWTHAFGMSPLWVFWENVQTSDGYREYHHVCPGFNQSYSCADGAEGIGINTYQNQVLELFTGVMMAGPHLTPQTFAQGEYNYPVTGGTPAHPLFKYTPDSPVWIKDMTEVWWNASGTGKAEAGNQTSGGDLMKAEQGKRFGFTAWPTANPYVFGQDPSPVFTSDAPYTAATGYPAHESSPQHTHPGNELCLSCVQTGADTFN